MCELACSIAKRLFFVASALERGASEHAASEVANRL